MLGTNRDVYRMENRVFAGKESDVLYEPLLTYTNLVNYISIMAIETKKQNVCFDFVKFLLSENIQKKLNDIGLFSTTINNVYSEGVMQEIEER